MGIFKDSRNSRPGPTNKFKWDQRISRPDQKNKSCYELLIKGRYANSTQLNSTISTCALLVSFWGLALFAGSHVLADTHHSGATLGDLSVDSGGAAKYSIKLELPPGTAGMQPNLSFRYSSQTKNGLLGVGWSLQGAKRTGKTPPTLLLASPRVDLPAMNTTMS